MLIAALVASSLHAASAVQADGPPDHRAVSLALAKIAGEHPELAALVPVGTSRGGRRIEALRLAAGERGNGRPAILVVANVEGPWVWTSGLALEAARKLSAGYANDARAKALLDTTTLYIVPCPNPDAAEARFAKPLLEQRAGAPWGDDDRDGRAGEDGPADVDGDGLVTWIRKPDPEGEWMADPADARALVKAERAKGERGTWKLFVEGRDSDQDEKVGEDPLLDVQVGRNFPHAWKEHAPSSGPFATSEPEAQALCEFVLTHKDIALVVCYGAQDNLVEKPKTAKDEGGRGVLTATPESDGALLAEIGKRYGEVTQSKAKGGDDAAGSFQAWCELQRGLWCLDIAPWSLPLDTEAPKKADSAPAPVPGGEGEAPKDAQEKPKEKSKDKKAEREPSDDAKRLRWVDAKGESARFVPWKSFAHPELGPVEIGGFAPYALIEPPAAERAELEGKQVEFLTGLGALLPRVALVDVTAKDLGGVWKVEAVLQVDALLPLTSTAGRRTGALRPLRVELVLPAQGRLLAGDKQTLVRELAGSGGRRELTWLVAGVPPSSISIAVDSDACGTPRATPTVKR